MFEKEFSPKDSGLFVPQMLIAEWPEKEEV